MKKIDKENDFTLTVIMIAVVLVSVMLVIIVIGEYSNQIEVKCINHNSSWLSVYQDDSHFTACVTNSAMEDGFTMIGKGWNTQ
jgi:uncharacterized membrane protein YqhA